MLVAANKVSCVEVTLKVPALAHDVPLLVLYSTRPAVSASAPYLA